MPETQTETVDRAQPGGVHPGDVYRYEPESTWCRDGWAIAEKRPDGRVVLADTYWLTDRVVVTPANPEFQFNLRDYDEITHREWERYAEADRRYIPKHAGLSTVYLVRKGARPDLATEIEAARERVADAEQEVGIAEFRLRIARSELAALEERVERPEGERSRDHRPQKQGE